MDSSSVNSLKDRIHALLLEQNGLTDREVTNILIGKNKNQQQVNQVCRSLEVKQIIKRIKRTDGKIGNYISLKNQVVSDISESNILTEETTMMTNVHTDYSEDNIKKILVRYLNSRGWKTQVAWGRLPGIDINAIRGNERWIIEVKGLGSSNPMNVNYFLGILAETLQRMDDPNAKYSIALPDVRQFRNLWTRLPILAKKRTGISALFINEQGEVREEG
ncbi:MarR family transcriptional regulator [Paenibacillus sp. LMG 31459]|uniref:MarR family transcriptional regulator n=1 Tax=Paenibacillus phytohabitans TaxID=2654978 RepID=A0ABX1YHM9_9BACL|nr:MarR family transcriptional regulator [Paenibacillus phytohabitans]NOU80351.1 MarR family transcriptional regulator [Paenibacillus phytohabitans]